MSDDNRGSEFIYLSTCNARREQRTLELKFMAERIDRLETSMNTFCTEMKNTLEKSLEQERLQDKKDRDQQFSNLKFYIAGIMGASGFFIVVIDYLLKLFMH